MCNVGHKRLEEMLVRHYAARPETARPAVADPAVLDKIVRAMLDESTLDKRDRPNEARPRSRRMGFAAFVAAQAGFVPAWTWMAQVAIVAVMGAIAVAGGDADATKLAVGILSAAAVLVGVPTVHASKLHGVAELEYSCPNNTASVVVARLIGLGCSSALAVLLMTAVTAAYLDLGVFVVALWAMPPFFSSCAGCLYALRKAAPSAAAALCAFWAVTCSAALLAFAGVFPKMYAEASLAVWAGAAAVALAWLVREVVMTLRSAWAGLDGFSPQMARTCS
jgi:hypothetical protein